MSDISAAQKALTDLGSVVNDIIAMVKTGGGIKELPELIGLLKDLRDLFEDAKTALPELKGLDAADAGSLATQAYSMIQSVVKSLS